MILALLLTLCTTITPSVPTVAALPFNQASTKTVKDLLHDREVARAIAKHDTTALIALSMAVQPTATATATPCPFTASTTPDWPFSAWPCYSWQWLDYECVADADAAYAAAINLAIDKACSKYNGAGAEYAACVANAEDAFTTCMHNAFFETEKIACRMAHYTDLHACSANLMNTLDAISDDFDSAIDSAKLAYELALLNCCRSE